MFSYINRTIFDIPLTWDRARFEATRHKCRQARKLIDFSVNVQFEKRLKNVYLDNIDVEKQIHECQEHLLTHEKKVHVLDNLMDVASDSLPNYFDKRMEHVRASVQEHCDAIQRIIREETEHWTEIHLAIDQNLITSNDLHPPTANQTVTPNIQTIDEVDEENEEDEQQQEQEDPSHLVNENTVTSILTRMIRKTQSKRRSMASATPMETDVTTENNIPLKQERQSVRVPSIKSYRILPPIDTTYVVKLGDETNNESAPMAFIPTENSAASSTAPVEASPIFSQPNAPARLYFSPTLLHDDADDPEMVEEPSKNESITKKQTVLSPLDQNQIAKPRLHLRRLGQTFVLDNMKTDEATDHHRHQTESHEAYMRPTISDDQPILVDMRPGEPIGEADENIPSSITAEEKPKRRTRAVVKIEPRPIRAARTTQKSVETNRRTTRKRKQSASEETDPKSTTIALRKRKAVTSVEREEKKTKTEKKKAKTTTRKTKKTKEPEIPIREPSPLPLIDRSKHYSTRFSTRSHRFNNFTLPILHTESDDDHNETKVRPTRARLPKKSQLHQSKETINDQTMTKKSKKLMKTRETRKTKKKSNL